MVFCIFFCFKVLVIRCVLKNPSLFHIQVYFLFIMLQYWICFFVFRDIDSRNETAKELQSFAYIFLYTNNAFEFLIFGFTSVTEILFNFLKFELNVFKTRFFFKPRKNIEMNCIRLSLDENSWAKKKMIK